ncbi:PTS system D-mannitol-specific IIA component, Fru family [Peptostreptococcus russellii]|uniref:Mannitol-specific phosphotransferase enzyme IIA component n=1 Tax=Peptostreptococcus russellii TaxID=215200 RepID=A0A1H8KMV3_9FIRM|nr:PTS sugar transporter subunit IIA [Peptostreptococcus russellii]SEN93728.1 PTS system D-mannitol-specific IIA component, Fru family [Peptostreptococcus russellii]
MNISNECTYFNLDSMQKMEAIKLAGEKLLENGFIEEAYIQSMLDKEKTDLTYIGNGIAIPHGLNDAKQYVKKSGIVLLHFPEGIDYDENKVFLMIGIAGKDDDHLEILQDIAIKLSEMDFVNSLLSSETKEEFITLFNS